MQTTNTQQRPPQPTTEKQTTLRILQVVAFTFVVYFSVGVPIAVLPMYLHLRLGISPSLAGLLVSIQYIATFASRPLAGRMADTYGPRQIVRYGMLFCASSGVLLLVAALFKHSLGLTLSTLVLSRLALGIGESMGSTGSTMWGIGRVGPENTARVISWNGVASYLGLALGAPLGALMEPRWGFAAVGLLIFILCVASFAFATLLAPTLPLKGQHVPLGRILMRVSPYGLVLALGGMGFGVIATFITLYFAHRNWQGAAISLTIYGFSFIAARLVFSRSINRFGGFQVAIVSFVTEVVGLVLLSFGDTPALAYAGCGLSGVGFSLIFPALGVEAANVFPVSVRGSVLGVYTAFVDLSLFLTGPLAGAVIYSYGYRAVFLATAGAVGLALCGTLALASSAKGASAGQ